MNSQTISLMTLFFMVYCGTDGRVPRCAGCEHYNRLDFLPGCDHPENPYNKEILK